jgi:hypothetical protein
VENLAEFVQKRLVNLWTTYTIRRVGVVSKMDNHNNPSRQRHYH